MDEAERGRGTETKKEKEKEMQKWIKGMDIKKGGEADTGPFHYPCPLLG